MFAKTKIESPNKEDDSWYVMPSHNPPWLKPISFLPDLNPTSADLAYPLAKTPLSSSYKEYRNFADIFPQDLTESTCAFVS